MTRYALIAAVLLLALAIIVCWPAELASSNLPNPGQPRVVSVETTDWLEALRDRQTVMFRVEVAADSKPRGEGVEPLEWQVTGVGPIEERAKAVLQSKLNLALRAGRTRLWTHQEKMDLTSESDLVQEALLMEHVAYYEAEIAQLANDEYIAVPKGSRLPASIPGARVFFQNIVESKGQLVDVMFVVQDSYPGVSDAREMMREMGAFYWETKARRFNGQSKGERIRQVMDSKTALENLMALNKSTEFRRMSPDRQHAARKAYWAKMLPSRFKIDESSFTVSLFSNKSKK